MGKVRLTRTWLVVAVCATVGLIVGVIAAGPLTGREERFTAQTTLAMLPKRNLPLDQESSFWEVLNRGQATGSAAIVLADQRWLDSAATADGVPKSELAITAGAIPDTTLITVTVTAPSAKAAEVVLNSVLAQAVRPAAEVSGPFRLETVAPPGGSATAMAPSPTQTVGAMGIAGLLVGAGAGFIICRSVRERSGRKLAAAAQTDDSPVAVDTTNHRVAATGDNIAMVEISLR